MKIMCMAAGKRQQQVIFKLKKYALCKRQNSIHENVHHKHHISLNAFKYWRALFLELHFLPHRRIFLLDVGVIF